MKIFRERKINKQTNLLIPLLIYLFVQVHLFFIRIWTETLKGGQTSVWHKPAPVDGNQVYKLNLGKI